MDGEDLSQSVLLSNFAANINAHRLMLNMSQEDFTKELGVHRTFVGSIERRERNLTIGTIEKLAAKIGLDALKLLAPPSRATLRLLEPKKVSKT